MSNTAIKVGNVQLTRVSYADVGVEPVAVGLTAEQVESVSWAEPTWARDGEVRAGAAAWIIESGGARIVVDPAGAVDSILRSDNDAAAHQEAFAALLDAAGMPRESFTHAIATHLDGIGMFAWRNDDGSWAPFFPNAPILMSQRELDRVDTVVPPIQGVEALAELRARGVVQVVTADVEPVADDVSIEFTGGHSLGHQIVRIDSQGEHAVMIGHLAVSALHLAREECPAGHEDSVEAERWIDALLTEDAVLIGPLWPEPGAARWQAGGLVPVSA